jgi:hypothetical protein
MEYENVIKNGLKLKGNQLSVRGKNKKSLGKKKNLNSVTQKSETSNQQKDIVNNSDLNALQKDKPNDQQLNEANTDMLFDNIIDPSEKLTIAEKAFRLAQKKRELSRTHKKLELTHRQRMERFNAQLITLPERNFLYFVLKSYFSFF